MYVGHGCPHSLFCAAWTEVRNDSNSSVDWIIAGYDGTSKTDITVIAKGSGGVSACSASLPEGQAVFGGCRLESGRFVTFFYADEDTPTMQKGRSSMHKNGESNMSCFSLDATLTVQSLTIFTCLYCRSFECVGRE